MIVITVMSHENMSEFLARHPKMTGVLFTALLLLSQAGTVLADGGQAYFGP